MRKFHFTLLLMVVLLLVIGLSVALTANDPLAENKARMRDFYDEVFNKHNLDAFDEFCTADFVDHNLPPGYAPGREGVKQLFKGFFAGFPDLQVSVEDIIAEGDKVAARVTVRGTHKGEFMGIAATGKEITLSVMDFVRISEGKAVERWGVEDMLGMMHQLGVIPSPAPALETVTLAVTGMAWGGCAKAVQVALENVPGVESVQIDLSASKAVVEVETGKATAEQLVSAVDKAQGMAKYSATVAGAQ